MGLYERTEAVKILDLTLQRPIGTCDLNRCTVLGGLNWIGVFYFVAGALSGIIKLPIPGQQQMRTIRKKKMQHDTSNRTAVSLISDRIKMICIAKYVAYIGGFK